MVAEEVTVVVEEVTVVMGGEGVEEEEVEDEGMGETAVVGGEGEMAVVVEVGEGVVIPVLGPIY